MGPTIRIIIRDKDGAIVDILEISNFHRKSGLFLLFVQRMINEALAKRKKVEMEYI